MSVFRTSLTLQMAIATVLGIVVGLFFGEMCVIFDPWASAYIMILKITTIPYLVGAIMHGVGQLSSTQAKEIMKKGIMFIGLAWGINIFMIYLTSFLFPHTTGIHQSSYNPHPPPPVNFAELLIPENIFYSLSNNIVPAVVVFAILVGIALMHIKDKAAMMGTLQTLVDSLTSVTSWISRITPIGTFIIIADQVGTIQLATVKQISTYIILYILAVSLVVFWIFPRLISMMTSLSSFKWLKDMLPILLLAYTTNVVIVCLPFIMQLVQRETQILYPKDEKAQSQIQGTVSIVFNLPLGSLFIALFIFFVASFYHIHLTLASQIQLFLTAFLTSLGSVGIGAWINSLTFMVDALGLPIDSVDLFLTSVPFTGGFQAMVSAMQVSCLSLFITFACRHLIIIKWPKIIRSGLITAAPVLLLMLGLKFYNPFPKPQDMAKSIYELDVRSDVQAILYTEQNNPPPPAISTNEDTFDRVVRTKKLRVGYSSQTTPFCFFNNEKQLVGYDIAFAYELAHDLDCRLELIPLDYGTLVHQLNSNKYDIAMSSVSISEVRLKNLLFTRPYNEGKIVFVAPDKYRRQFADLGEVQANYSIKIFALKGSYFEHLTSQYFQHHEVVLLDKYDAFANQKGEALILWSEPEAISWSLRHPHYEVIFPKPTLGIDSLAYPIKADGGERFLGFLNQWMKLKENEGFTQRQYDMWVLGKTAPSEAQEPRWSVIRNVFHWVK